MPRRPGTKAAGPHSGEDNRALLVAGKLAFVAVSAFSYFVLTALRWTPLLTYAWTQTQGPAVTLNPPNGAKPTFTPTTAGTYIFSLVVSDGNDKSAPATVAVVVKDASNQAPIANAGVNQSVKYGVVITLDGSASSDPDNGPSPLTYAWTQTEGPKVTLTRPKTAKPTFKSTVPGKYVFRLVVSDGKATSAPAFVTINVQDVQLWVLYPNGGETLKVGNKVTLKWYYSKSLVDPKQRVTLLFSKNSGARWSEIDDHVKNTGAYQWKPNKNAMTSHGRIQVCLDRKGDDDNHKGDGTPHGPICDASDWDFRIVR